MKKEELPYLYTELVERLHVWLTGLGVTPEQMAWTGLLVGIVLVLAAMVLLSKLLNWLFTMLLHRLSVTTVSELDDNLIKRKTPRYVARIIPLVLAYNLIPAVFVDFLQWAHLAEVLFNIFFILLAVRILRSVLHASKDTLADSDTYRSKPLDSYMQVLSLVLWIIAGVLVFSQLTGRSALGFLTAMGAASAVLLLIFKDTILGFVASIQISANDLVRLGDWITMPKYGADGNVTEINLTTVMVENFDMTITTIPTYALISDSFQNWRGMQEAGGRRIKRSIRIKLSSVRYLNEREIEELRKVELLTAYIDERREEIRKFNTENKVDKSMLVNGRNMTNVGLFRRYMERYALNYPGVRQDMTKMVRQLPPDEQGLPLELYCFAADIRWEAYENLMSDIFDHLLASTGTFGLEVFENPASDDVRFLGGKLRGES
ncbi:MAG: mechanosensitive ion channel family protein [Flavobacteriales bacterium]|jgi:miniconductance mechanosensitive channel|nr:mechanosensitive ion channel family protein [Flavobacteriales bacterium]